MSKRNPYQPVRGTMWLPGIDLHEIEFLTDAEEKRLRASIMHEISNTNTQPEESTR
jgi:hypothetical protein